MNSGATTRFAISGRAASRMWALVWQPVGSAFGLGRQLTFGGMARPGGVRPASAFGIGLAFALVDLVSAHILFGERFARGQWAGVGWCSPVWRKSWPASPDACGAFGRLCIQRTDGSLRRAYDVRPCTHQAGSFQRVCYGPSA